MVKLVDLIKYEGDNSTFVWKHPCEDFNILSQLVVHESQEAAFMKNGQVMDILGPGRYTLDTYNIPILSKFLNRVFGDKDESPFHCEVYFINQTVQMGLKWGTDSKVRYIDPDSGIPLELGASGTMNLRVLDSRKLLTKLVGTMNGIAWENEGDGFTQSLRNSFRPMIATAVKSNLSTAIKADQIDILEVDEHLTELSKTLQDAITPGFEEYGLTIPEFFLTTVVLPETDPNFRKLKDLRTISLQKRVAMAEAEVRQAQVEAEALVSKTKAQTEAEITEARRVVELEKQTTEIEIARKQAEKKIIETQAEAQAKAISAQGEAQAIRAEGLAEAEVMRAKGYTEKDVIQADVQKAYAEGLGQFGSNVGSGGGGGSSPMSDIMGIGIGLQAANAMGKQFGNLFEGMNQTSQESQPSDTISCPNCGKNLPNTAKFCLECGSPIIRKCPSCGNELPAGAKFCFECGQKI